MNARNLEFEYHAFGKVKGEHAKNMWRMLLESQKDKELQVSFKEVEFNDDNGSAKWEAKYVYSKSGRPVHNKITASFEIVNGKITKRHVCNLIVYGNTLYLDEGNDGRNVYYFQLAIRISDDVYLLNDISKHREIQYKVKDVIALHMRAYGRYITLKTLNHKKKDGEVNQKLLKNSIDEYPLGRIKTALKKYGREQMQAAAIDNIQQLNITLERLEYPNRKKYYDKLIIAEASREIRHVRKVCAMLDKYLNILTQLPERNP